MQTSASEQKSAELLSPPTANSAEPELHAVLQKYLIKMFEQLDVPRDRINEGTALNVRECCNIAGAVIDRLHTLNKSNGGEMKALEAYHLCALIFQASEVFLITALDYKGVNNREEAKALWTHIIEMARPSLETFLGADILSQKSPTSASIE